MNRPNFKDYLNPLHYENDYESYDAYIGDLEKYCDYLENDVIAKAAWKLAKYDKNDIQYWKEYLYDVSRR